jgi:hypothetical protein
MHDLRTLDRTAIASAFARAAAAGDRDELRALLAADVELRALTPSRSWALDSADDAIDTIVGLWFGGDRHVKEIEQLEADMIGDMVRVGYRFRATTSAGSAVVEQQAFLAITGGKIGAVRLVCSGYHLVPD